jgi:hypothetical protein
MYCFGVRSRQDPFRAQYQAKYPKAVESLAAHWERLRHFLISRPSIGRHLRTNQRDRIGVCHRAAARAGDQRSGITNQGVADGL